MTIDSHHLLAIIFISSLNLFSLQKWLDSSLSATEASEMFTEPSIVNWYPVQKDFYSDKLKNHPLTPISVE